MTVTVTVRYSYSPLQLQSVTVTVRYSYSQLQLQSVTVTSDLYARYSYSSVLSYSYSSVLGYSYSCRNHIGGTVVFHCYSYSYRYRGSFSTVNKLHSVPYR